MIKLNIALLAIIISIGYGYGQSKDMDLIHSGDVAMKENKYTLAIYYYLQVDNSLLKGSQINSKTDGEIYYPYSLGSHQQSQTSKKESNPQEKPKATLNKEDIIMNKLANAYRLAKDYTNAEKYYATAVQYPSSEFPNAEYYYGCALINNGKYNEAKSVFEKLIEKRNNKEDPISQLSSKRIKDCDFGLHEGLTYDTPSIKTLGEDINFGISSFGMMYYNDGLIFASAEKSTPDNSDIYLTKKDTNGGFSVPQRFDGEANSPALEGATVISMDGKTMFFTRVDQLDPNNVSIYILRNFNGNWMKPFKLGENVNLEGYKSMMPCLGADEKTIYFASDRPGGYGGMDIWKTTINDMGEATEPVNLGENINTSEDEVSPFYHSISKTLYFSSNGQIGFGGFDVFKSTYNILTVTWNASDNLGSSVNSSMDDTYFIWGEGMKSGYLTSDREECQACDSSQVYNIHCNKIYEVNNPNFEIKIEGYVYDLKTNLPIPNSKVDFKDIRGNIENISILTDKNGFYEATLLENTEYFIKSINSGYFADATVKSTMGVVRPSSMQANFYLKLIPADEIEIKGIKYDFNSADLRDTSKIILNDLIDLLQLNNSLKVEIRSHTDSRGDTTYNIDLSQRRAQIVVDYLVEHDIQKDRLIPLGKGFSEPAIVNINGKEIKLDDQFIMSLPDKEVQEKYYQMNRRTAFKVLNP